MRIVTAGLATVLGIAFASGACAGKQKDTGNLEERTAPQARTPAGVPAPGAVAEPPHQAAVAEAKENLSKIYEGARVYFLEKQYDASGATVFYEKRFPASVPMTPPAGTCCKLPGGRCASPQIWNDHPSWAALRFSVDDPHYLSYELVASGEGEAATFTARAAGDLDCDGVFSTFEMMGKVDADRTVGASAGMFMANEQE